MEDSQEECFPSHRLTRLDKQDSLGFKTTILAKPDFCAQLSLLSSPPTQRDDWNICKKKATNAPGWEDIPAVSFPPPALLWRLADTNAEGGSSWHRHGSSTERSSIMNTKSASDKGYHFQTPCSLTCTSALPFIIAFSLPFSLSPPLSGKI